MKPGPVVAMVALILLGVWLVLQPTLQRESYDFAVSIGAGDVLVRQVDIPVAVRAPGDDQAEGLQVERGYAIVGPKRLVERIDGATLSPDAFAEVLADETNAWNHRPALERKLLGFFNITSWVNFTWVALGLAGQAAFFGRMLVQWIVSEKSRRSQVPELFWWLSFLGGLCLFTYFVWRVDVVGVLGQSTGVVIYARNLRLIHKQKRRESREAIDSSISSATEGPPQGNATTTPDH